MPSHGFHCWCLCLVVCFMLASVSVMPDTWYHLIPFHAKCMCCNRQLVSAGTGAIKSCSINVCVRVWKLAVLCAPKATFCSSFEHWTACLIWRGHAKLHMPSWLLHQMGLMGQVVTVTIRAYYPIVGRQWSQALGPPCCGTVKLTEIAEVWIVL